MARCKARSRPIRDIWSRAIRRKRRADLLQQGRSDMFKKASSLGVQTITLPEFLNADGLQAAGPHGPFGTGAHARDFPARAENVNGPEETNASRFRTRRQRRRLMQPAGDCC